MGKIERADRFLREELKKCPYFQKNERSGQYRYEHSVRVANIGKEIARKEGLDEERLMIACLLHDVGYSVEFTTNEIWNDHGRIGAKIARPFLRSLGYDGRDLEEMCYAIAIHADGKADFEFENTPFALSVGDADNVDRFDAFRLYEGLATVDYRNLPLEKQLEYVRERTELLEKYRAEPCGTKTATKMWQRKIDEQIEFLRRLQSQAEHSTIETLFAPCEAEKSERTGK